MLMTTGHRTECRAGTGFRSYICRTQTVPVREIQRPGSSSRLGRISANTLTWLRIKGEEMVRMQLYIQTMVESVNPAKRPSV